MAALVTVTALASVGLVACSGSGGSEDASGPITLQTWGDVKNAQNQFAAYKAAFPADAKGQSLKVESAGANDSDAVAKLRLQLSSGKNIPDIVELNYSELPEFAESGVLADLTELAKPYVGNVTDSAKTLMKYNGKVLAFPYEVKEKLWFYRTDMFQKAGIDVASVKTQDDFIAAGKKLQAAFPSSFIWNVAPNPQQYQWGMIVSGNGAKYSTKSPKCGIAVGTDKGTAEAFTALKALRSSGVVDTTHDDFTPEWQAGLANGSIASSLGASWLPVFLQQYAPDLAGKWGVTTWPEIGGAKGGSEAGGSLFVITDASKHKQAAAKFLGSTLMTSKGTAEFMKTQTGYIPNVTDLLNDPKVQNNAYFGPSLIKAFVDSSKTYKLFAFDPAANKETMVLSAQLANYLSSSDASPEAALATAQQQLASQVGCPYGK
ncbi:ABC transporter substrate-binding protein [Leifsonia sp. L25]|uniref:ABC transporter substrate-binding protein n=1 Tax=Actinomycetes TaxID=1760 RepID=UPI003D693A83